jgi:hypothetical protein
MEGLLQLESRFQSYDTASKMQMIDANSELSSQLEQLTLERVSDRYIICIGKCGRCYSESILVPGQR